MSFFHQAFNALLSVRHFLSNNVFVGCVFWIGTLGAGKMKVESVVTFLHIFCAMLDFLFSSLPFNNCLKFF